MKNKTKRREEEEVIGESTITITASATFVASNKRFWVVLDSGHRVVVHGCGWQAMGGNEQ